MTKLRVENGAAYQPVRAARGASISCKSWQQEAALRMLMNNLDPDVAERPEELIVYGGTGKAARNWACFHAIVESLRGLENDETLLVQSGKPVGIFKTHEYAPFEPWYEPGPEPVFAAADEDEPSAFVRVLVLPHAWEGKRTIRYVDPADENKPKLQRATVFFERPIRS